MKNTLLKQATTALQSHQMLLDEIDAYIRESNELSEPLHAQLTDLRQLVSQGEAETRERFFGAPARRMAQPAAA